MRVSRLEFVKKLLPGFVPLFVFIAADEIWGTKVGIIVAVIVGLAEYLWVLIREKKSDRFILFDTLLLIVLGAVSLLLHNDIFFKIKPGLIELILVIILGLSAFSSVNIVALMSKRYMKDFNPDDAQFRQMKKSLKWLFYIFTVHTALIFYAAFFMNKEAWAFISGGLFYIIFGVYFLFELGRQRLKQKRIIEADATEWLPVIDSKGKVIGKVSREKAHDGGKILHPVIHLMVIGKNKSILLQKRSQNKQVHPGKWDTSVGGHILFGESLDSALKREAAEELGLTGFSARLIKAFLRESDNEAELVYFFVTFDAGAIVPNKEEVEEARYWTLNQIRKYSGEGIFTPHLEQEISIMKNEKYL